MFHNFFSCFFSLVFKTDTFYAPSSSSLRFCGVGYHCIVHQIPYVRYGTIFCTPPCRDSVYARIFITAAPTGMIPNIYEFLDGFVVFDLVVCWFSLLISTTLYFPKQIPTNLPTYLQISVSQGDILLFRLNACWRWSKKNSIHPILHLLTESYWIWHFFHTRSRTVYTLDVFRQCGTFNLRKEFHFRSKLIFFPIREVQNLKAVARARYLH